MDTRDHAVVIGASIAGLLTATVLREYFDAVTIVERDDLPADSAPRSGVPQSAHLHVLQQGGTDSFEQLLPGFAEEMEGEGSALMDSCKTVARYMGRGWLTRAASDQLTLAQRRSLLEHVMRRRVSALPGVTVCKGTVTGLLSTRDRTRVSGVRVTGGRVAERDMAADLVVDAGGRGSRAPRWLEDLGYESPVESTVESHMGYASRLLRVPDDAWPGDMVAMNSMPLPGRPRGAVIYIQDNGAHIITLVGQDRDYPPKGEAEFTEYLRTCICPALHDVYLKSEPLTEISTSRTGVNRLRRYDLLKRRPKRFFSIGDAMCAFNPIYGQGMTTAGLAALKFRDELRRIDDLDEVVRLLPSKLVDVTNFAWRMATGTDSAYASAEISNWEPAPDAAQAAAYFRDVQDFATVDAATMVALIKTQGTMDPQWISSPDVRSRVAAWRAAGGVVANTDPLAPPAGAVERAPV
jgi:2-polyprenyl-6-methoxyphenol hydroxylase-like FAD-dependent oxidoreductase